MAAVTLLSLLSSRMEEGYRKCLAFTGPGSFTADLEREVLKRKIVGNCFLFNFVFYTIFPQHSPEEVGALSGLFCATPRIL
jgi:hypothetical protein